MRFKVGTIAFKFGHLASVAVRRDRTNASGDSPGIKKSRSSLNPAVMTGFAPPDIFRLYKEATTTSRNSASLPDNPVRNKCQNQRVRVFRHHLTQNLVDGETFESVGFSDFLTMNHYVDGKKYFTNENVRVRQKKLELNVEKTKRMMFNKRKSEENEWNEEIKQGSGMCVGNRREEYIDVRDRDLGMEGTSRESARKIFEMGTTSSSGQRNAREECKRSNGLRVKAGKRAAKFKEKMDGTEECRILREYWRKKKNKEKKEREKNGSKMIEREEKEREDKLNEDGREIEWMKEIWKRREKGYRRRGVENRPLEISGGGYGGVLSTDYESKQTSVWCDSFPGGHPGPAANTALHSKERIIKSKRSHNQFSLFKGEHKEKQVVWEILNLLLMQIMANLVLERQSEERTPSRDKTNEEICWKIHFRGQLTAAAAVKQMNPRDKDCGNVLLSPEHVRYDPVFF
ncbi:hypothetical protein GEV33_012600 [Tenebrio molitor]|uniref:Uncharacterized protein n=1 Tax=Tenebrio molitor TaxID=7067 RepID=A0A8J6H9F2_TENMO|nr:hypothetical protein GEV33_012600 [Tenebrio molitor]